MRKPVFMLLAILMASCSAKTVSDETRPEQPVDPAPGDPVEISVTLPELVSVNAKAGFVNETPDPEWKDGDRIKVGNEVFTLIRSTGKKGVFSGKIPEGEIFDILYPADVAAASVSFTQKCSGDYSHIPYSASLYGVDTYKDIVFAYDWAGAHGGTFSQTGILRLNLNFPSVVNNITSVSFSADGESSISIGIENGALDDGCFVAYLPCGEIVFQPDRYVKITVTTTAGDSYSNTFLPGRQILPDAHLNIFTTSALCWCKDLVGDGSKDNPYIISTGDDFDHIRNLIVEGAFTWFLQDQDIDLSGFASFEPINGQNKAFGIMYDGAGHTISGYTSSYRGYASLFGLLHGEVKNLYVKNPVLTTNTGMPSAIIAAWVGNIGGTLHGRIENVHITGGLVSNSSTGQVGGIGARAGSAEIINCSFEGTVERTNASGDINIPAGGIVACSENDIVISRCYSSGTVKGANYVGGIVGKASNTGLAIDNCGSSMNVSSSGYYVGGIVGDAPANTVIKNCFSTGSVIGRFALGGIVGRAFGLQSSAGSLDTNVNTTVEGCLAFNTSIKTSSPGKENPASHYSGAAVIGFSSKPNTLKNCWRSRDMVFDFYADSSLNILFDHSDSSPSSPLVQPAGSAKYYSPYHGKAVNDGQALCGAAKAAGWSSEIWDLEGSVPVLR